MHNNHIQSHRLKVPSVVRTTSPRNSRPAVRGVTRLVSWNQFSRTLVESSDIGTFDHVRLHPLNRTFESGATKGALKTASNF